MGKSSGGTTETKTSQNQNQQFNNTNTLNTGPWAPQQPFIEDIFNKAQANFPSSQVAYGGPRVAEWNPSQQRAASILDNLGQSPNIQGALDQNLKTINGDYLNSNPWVDKTFGVASDAVKRQYMTGTAPQTAGAMAAAGRYGSGAYRNLVSGNEQNYGKTLDDLATSIYGGNYANERGLQQQAVGMAPALDQARYYDGNVKMAVGDRLQQQRQAELNGAMAQFNETRDQPTKALATYLGLVQGNYGQSGTTNQQGTSSGTMTGTQQTPYYTNPAASALGGGLGLASLFSGGSNSAASGIGSAASGLGGLFGKGAGEAAAAGGVGSLMGSTMASLGPLALMGSDRRIKTDIRKVGTTNDGQNVYSFRYIGSPRTEIGLMAQEVEKVHPEAVVEIHGIKHVNYALALKDAA